MYICIINVIITIKSNVQKEHNNFMDQIIFMQYGAFIHCLVSCFSLPLFLSISLSIYCIVLLHTISLTTWSITLVAVL